MSTQCLHCHNGRRGYANRARRSGALTAVAATGAPPRPYVTIIGGLLLLAATAAGLTVLLYVAA